MTKWMALELVGDFEDYNHVEFETSMQYPFKVDVYSFRMVCLEILIRPIPFHEINSITFF